MAFEVGEALLPELPILFRPARNVLDPVGLELINALSTLPSLADETRPPQHAQVSRDCRPAHTKSGDELVHMRVTSPKPIEDRPPRGIGNCEKHIGCGGRTGHRKIGNVSVTYYKEHRQIGQGSKGEHAERLDGGRREPPGR